MPAVVRQIYEKRIESVVVAHPIAVDAVCKTAAVAGVRDQIIPERNEEDLDEITIQTIQPYPGINNRQIVSDVEIARKGTLQNVTKVPLKVDMVFDPNFKLNNNDATNIKLGAFGYFRTELKEDKKENRIGFGLCLLSTQDPSQIFSSLGYEIPTFGEGVEKNQKNGKGTVFASIGYSIF